MSGCSGPALLVNEHDQEADGQQGAGHPDSPDGGCAGQQGSQTGTQGEQADDAEICQGIAQGLRLMGVEIGTQGLCAAAHVADAHGAGVGVATDLAEGLQLHGAGEGHQGVGHSVQ